MWRSRASLEHVEQLVVVLELRSARSGRAPAPAATAPAASAPAASAPGLVIDETELRRLLVLRALFGARDLRLRLIRGGIAEM